MTDAINNHKIMRNSTHLLTTISIIISLLGCSISMMPIKDYADIAVGDSIYKLMSIPRVYGDPKTWRKYVNSNGNCVFAEPVWRNCEIHWEVDNHGTIIGYKLVGSECK